MKDSPDCRLSDNNRLIGEEGRDAYQANTRPSEFEIPCRSMSSHSLRLTPFLGGVKRTCCGAKRHEQCQKVLSMTDKKPIIQRATDVVKDGLKAVGSYFGYDFTANYEIGGDAIVLPIDMERDTVWATQAQIAEMFGTKRQAITKHIATIYGDKELDEVATSSKMELVQTEGDRTVKRQVVHYNLDLILAVGYRVSSKKASAFRKWASSVLKGYIQDGYALNGSRLDADPQALLRLSKEVRAIRTSEKNLYAQVREVFKLASIDYDPNSEEARKFFAETQDTMHYAATEMTASEIIVERSDASKPNMGIVALGNQRPTKADAQIAKNYCPADELRQMELIGEAFLLFVEGLAERDKQVSMARLLAKFRAVVEFYEYPVFPGYTYPRPTAAQAKKYASEQYEMFKGRAAKITNQ